MQFIESHHPLAEVIELVNFDFDSSSSYIKLSATSQVAKPQVLFSVLF